MGAPGSHEVISRALYALEQLEHRGGEGADPDTGDGSGILVQIPDAFLREEAGLELPNAGGYGVAMCFLPQDEELRRRAVELIERSVEAEGQRLIGWREVPIDESACGVAARGERPAHRPAVRGRGRGRRGRPRRVRAEALRDQAGGGARAARRPLDRELLLAHHRLQGDAHRAPALALLPGPERPALLEPAGAGALALLHEHLPELGARAPLPDARPQRRDQHAARQPQLDARPRGRPRPRSCSATTCRRSRRSCATTSPTPPRSTACWSCSCSAAARPRTRSRC